MPLIIIYNIKNEILFPCSEIISLNVYILFTDFNNSGKFTPFYHFAWGHNIADNVGVLVGQYFKKPATRLKGNPIAWIP